MEVCNSVGYGCDCCRGELEGGGKFVIGVSTMINFVCMVCRVLSFSGFGWVSRSPFVNCCFVRFALEAIAAAEHVVECCGFIVFFVAGFACEAVVGHVPLGAVGPAVGHVGSDAIFVVG